MSTSTDTEQPAAQATIEQPAKPTKKPRHKRALSLDHDFLTTEELLAELPVCRKTLFSYCAAGKLPYVKLGRRTIFHWPSVQSALLRQQRGGSA
jgi:hypothetical protein